MPGTSAQTALKRAVKGLTYESETDEPFDVFVWPREDIGGDLADAQVLSFHGAEPDSDEPAGAVERIALERFFAPLLEHKEWHRKQETAVVSRYRQLLDTIHEHLGDVRVYRIGSTKKGIYIVGKAKTGDWVGIKTAAVET